MELERVRLTLYDRIYKLLGDRPRRAIEISEPFIVGSTIGSVRAHNEDIGLVLDAKYGQSPDKNYTLGLICDGMGGLSEGRRAALIAASAFVSSILDNHITDSPPNRLRIALDCAQREVFAAFHGYGGTTLSAIFLDALNGSWIAHVGDSRIYAVADDSLLRQLSRDDTIGAALNMANEDRPDLKKLIQYVGCEDGIQPQIVTINRSEFRSFLLTTDGAHCAPTNILNQVVRHARNPVEVIRRILNLADALGGLDNATALHIPAASKSEAPQITHTAEARSGELVTLVCGSGLHDIWFFGPTERPIYQATGNADERKVDAAEREEGVLHSVLAAKRIAPERRRKLKAAKSKKLPKVVAAGSEKILAKLDFSDDTDKQP